MRTQKPIRPERPRRPTKGYMSRILESHIKQAAKEYNCSRSFIIAVACAELFGVKNQERYYK